MGEQNQNNNNQNEEGNQPKAEKDIPASEMKERVISEKVVSERVIGSSNSVARFGRKVKSRISSRLGGVGLGLLLILISFFVVWQSEKFEKSAADVADLPLLSVEQVSDSSGLVKVQGKVTSESIKTPREGKEVIYYRHTREELEMVIETVTETKMITRDGKDIEQTIEKEVERPKWVSKLDEVKWADIVLDEKITVVSQTAEKLFDYTTVYSHDEDKYREKVNAILASDQLIVVGEIYNNRIETGEPFIITNKSDQKLVDSLESSEKTTWWILKLATLLLFGFGLYSLLGPLLLVLDVIPIIGKIGKAGLFIVCMIIGLVFTILSSLIIAFWYVILIILVAVVAYLIYLKKKQPETQKQEN